MEAKYEFETSDLFGTAERSALRLARDAVLVLHASAPAHFADVQVYYSGAQFVEIVSVISLFGWLNCWTDTMATELEDELLSFAGEHLAIGG